MPLWPELSSYPGYFPEPNWFSMRPPEISRATLTGGHNNNNEIIHQQPHCWFTSDGDVTKISRWLHAIMCHNRTGIGLVLRASDWFWHGSGPIILASGLKPDKKCHNNSVQVHSFVWIIRRLFVDSKHKLYMSHRSVSLLPLLISGLIAQLSK